MNNLTGWPEILPIESDDPPGVVEMKKSLYQAQLDVYKAEQQSMIEVQKAITLGALTDDATHKAANLEREKAAYANEYVLYQSVHNAYIEVAKQQAASPATKAEFVQKAAAAISVAYVALVGLSFGVGESATPITVGGLLPTIFLGFSIFLSTAYTGFVMNPDSMQENSSTGSLPGLQFERRKDFLRWSQSATLKRRALLQASVASLGVATAYLPAPYLSLDAVVFMVLSAIGVLFCTVVPMVSRILEK